jgi:hypothetical protein
MHGMSRSRLVGLIRAVPYVPGATVEQYVMYHNKYTYKNAETMASRQDSSQHGNVCEQCFALRCWGLPGTYCNHVELVGIWKISEGIAEPT